MSPHRLAVLASSAALTALTPAVAQTQPTQLDRIEQKLDTILRRLDQMPATVAQPVEAPTAGTLSSVQENLAGGALAVVHAAPATPAVAHEIPPDSVGGFIYTGGLLQLADLSDHGVRYAGLTAVEWQGWLRAKEAGRYQLDVDGSTFSPTNLVLSTCIFAGWLEDRSIGEQIATPFAKLAQPAPFSLVLGAELQPGLYKIRLWATCTPATGVRDQRVSIALLEKAPSDLNLRSVTGDDLAHKQQ